MDGELAYDHRERWQLLSFVGEPSSLPLSFGEPEALLLREATIVT